MLEGEKKITISTTFSICRLCNISVADSWSLSGKSKELILNPLPDGCNSLGNFFCLSFPFFP